MTFPQTLTATEANKETPINEQFRGVKWAGLFSDNPATTTGLVFGMNGGPMLVDGVLTTIADQTVTCTVSTTNYVETTRAGVASTNTSGFTAGRIPLFVVTTSASGVSSFVDWRTWADMPGVAQRLSLSVAGSSNVTLTAAQARNEILNFTGLLTGNINVIVPDGPQVWTVTNNTTGAFTLTVKTSGGTGIAVTQTKALDLAADGTNVIATNNDAVGVGTGTVTSLTASNGARTSSGAAITTTGTIYGDSVTNAQVGTSYTVLTGDRGKLVTHSNGSAIAVTLPQAGASFPDGWYYDTKCIGAGTVTITPTTSTISGAATLVLTTGQSARIVSDGTNYTALTGGSSGAGTVTHTGGALTSNSVVLGAGSDDTKVVAGIVTDGTSVLTLGVAGSSVGGVALKNATSGTLTINPPAGALGTVTVTVPATTGTLYISGGTDVIVADGGTGLSSTTAYAVLCGGTTSTSALQSIASVGTSGHVLTSNGAGALPTFQAAGSGSGTKTYAVFTAMTSQPPASNYATLDTRNSIAVLDFDDSTQESIFWVGVMPESASLGSGLIVNIFFMATSATSGDCRFGAQFERMNTDEDSDSYDTATEATVATSGTSGIVTKLSITCTTIDSIAAGEAYRLLIYRDTTGADTITGDVEVVAVELRSAA